MMNDLERILGTILILVIPGLYAIGRGIWMLKGGSKGWYIARNLYSGFSYAQIPAGLCFLWFALAAIPKSVNVQYSLLWIGIAFGLFAVVVNFLQPAFLKPAWLKWLERNHGRIMSTLVKEARTMGLEAWQERVKMQEELEAWVDEVRRKHKLEE